MIRCMGYREFCSVIYNWIWSWQLRGPHFRHFAIRQLLYGLGVVVRRNLTKCNPSLKSSYLSGLRHSVGQIITLNFGL